MKLLHFCHILSPIFCPVLLETRDKQSNIIHLSYSGIYYEIMQQPNMLLQSSPLQLFIILV